MSFRPVPATWFEMLVLRDDLTAAIDVLAKSASVQLQGHGESCAPLLLPETRRLLEEFDTLQARYGRYWPPREAQRPDERCEPQIMLERAMTRLQTWSSPAESLVDRLETLSRQFEDMHLLQEILQQAENSLPDLQRLGETGPLLGSCLYLLASDDWPAFHPDGVILQRIATHDHHFLLAVGTRDGIDLLQQQLQTLKARPVAIPEGLPSVASEAAALVEERASSVGAGINSVRREIAALNVQYELANALADIDHVRWYLDNVPELASTESFAWITGWTSKPDEESLIRLLADVEVKGLLRLSQPPSDVVPPLLMSNPKWLRPFELFTSLLGMPAAGEVDPTRIVAIASPLMFGYMFGDVGHGFVLLVVGLVLHKRFPALKLLIAGGLASIAFGFLFGSVFGLDNIVHPLWMDPMSQPLTILLVPIAGGAVLLLIGMFFDGLQTYWRQRSHFWRETGAGLMLCYAAMLGSLRYPHLLWIALLGAIWFILGHAVAAQANSIAAIGTGTANFIESVFRLVVNTISFVRVGAFSLAHAGLSQAVVGVAEVSASLTAKLILLVMGNVLIIGLEGLVVGIQTTRLLLFEFFTRFLHAEGRPFKPMVLPMSNTQDGPRRD